jgi:hypothetical protein
VTKPQCLRCTKLGIECPGYPDKSSLIVRDDTSKTRARAQRMYQTLRKSRSQPETGLATGDAIVTRNSSSESSNNESLVINHLDILDIGASGTALNVTPPSFFKDALVAGSIGQFIGQWTEDSVKLFGSLETISNLYPDCEPCVSAAIETLSMWALSISEGGQNVNIDSLVKKMYGDCLKEINSNVQRIDELTDGQVDQLMVAIELVALFEVRAFAFLVPSYLLTPSPGPSSV